MYTNTFPGWGQLPEREHPDSCAEDILQSRFSCLISYFFLITKRNKQIQFAVFLMAMWLTANVWFYSARVHRIQGWSGQTQEGPTHHDWPSTITLPPGLEARWCESSFYSYDRWQLQEEELSRAMWLSHESMHLQGILGMPAPGCSGHILKGDLASATLLRFGSFILFPLSWNNFLFSISMLTQPRNH